MTARECMGDFSYVCVQRSQSIGGEDVQGGIPLSGPLIQAGSYEGGRVCVIIIMDLLEDWDYGRYGMFLDREIVMFARLCCFRQIDQGN